MPNETFRTELVSLREVFSGNLFSIPDYQRNYSWGEKQIRDMLDDLGSMMGADTESRHYTGTLVLTKSKSRSGAYDVIDGQQRLITLSILANSLARNAEKQSTRKELIETYVRRGDRGDERYVMELQSECGDYYRRAILEYRDGQYRQELDAHARLLKARNVIDEWLAKQKGNGATTERMRKILDRQLGFLVFAPTNSADAGTMFEVINNRGKALSELEKIKNYLVYCCAKLGADTTRNRIDETWTRVQKNLNRAGKVRRGEESAFVRYCLIVFAGLNKQESQSGYQNIKEIAVVDKAIQDKQERDVLLGWIERLLEFLGAASLWYSRLHGVHDNKMPEELASALDLLRGQSRHASIAPLFLAICLNSACATTQKAHLLQLLEIMNFRVYLARGITKRNDSGQAELFAVAQAYYAGRFRDLLVSWWGEDPGESVASEEDALEFYLVWFALSYASDEAFRRSFLLQQGDNEDFYNWTGLRYFLYCYENNRQIRKSIPVDRLVGSRADTQSGEYLSIEHLWGAKNYGWHGNNTRGCDRRQKKRLGNFVLLDLRSNIQGTDENLEDKLPRYLNGKEGANPTELKQVREVDDDLRKAKDELEDQYDRRSKNYDFRMHKKIEDAREDRLVTFACDRWSLAGFLGYEIIAAYEG